MTPAEDAYADHNRRMVEAGGEALPPWGDLSRMDRDLITAEYAAARRMNLFRGATLMDAIVPLIEGKA